jgi:hypothetical protein
MKRLNFRLHDFTRISWVSDQAKNVWQPRIHRVNACWQQIEWLSVEAGLRACTLRMIQPEALQELSAGMGKHNLAVLAIDKCGVSESGYSALKVEPVAGRPFHHRVVIGSRANTEEFQYEWAADNQAAIRALSGYPPCCSAFFENVWIQERYADTTWPMAANTPTKVTSGHNACKVEGPPLSNILLRWLGVRPVPHLPCSFNCTPTVELGRQYLDLAKASGFAAEVEWLLSILDWPVEWSALHGIAEIKTPILKIATLSDATSEKYTVQRGGNQYPSEGARGLSFPYRSSDAGTSWVDGLGLTRGRTAV